jgi:hypothetical protein
MGVELFSTDYVLLKHGEPLEPLDVMYAKQTVIELVRDGFVLRDGEAFVSMAHLPDGLKERYTKAMGGSK